jgi:hypothetical protein
MSLCCWPRRMSIDAYGSMQVYDYWGAENEMCKISDMGYKTLIIINL